MREAVALSLPCQLPWEELLLCCRIRVRLGSALMPTNFTVVPVEAQGGERDSAERDAWRQEEEEDNRDRGSGERGEQGGVRRSGEGSAASLR